MPRDPQMQSSLSHIMESNDAACPNGRAMTQQQSSSSRVLIVGDSDISRWPSELLPAPIVSGHSGAVLSEIVPHVETALQGLDSASMESMILVACAGENDVGNGLTLDDTLLAFQDLLRVFFSDEYDTIPTRRLLFLGPKIEPWLDNDPTSRKHYVKMSRAFQRACSKHERSDAIHFVDCLTMFCGESAHVPGATLGGKAKAEPIYFENDQLHLNQEGYKVWQQVVQDHLSDHSS